MDGVTHGIAGLLLGELCEEPATASRRRRFFWAAISLAPDLDGLAGAGGPIYYFAYHRRIFHGLPGMALLALLGGLAYHYLGFGSRKRGITLSALAVALHVFFDTVTSFGTTLLYPLSRVDYSLDLLFIVDLAFSSLLLLFLLLQIYRGNNSKRWVYGGMGVMACYLLLATAMNYSAQSLVKTEVSKQRYPLGVVTVIPQPPSVFHWAAFIQTEQGYWAGPLSLLDGKVHLRHYQLPKKKALYERACQTEAGKRFLRFARFPHVVEKSKEDGVTYNFIDLRFLISGKEKANYYFGSTVQMSLEGKVLAQGLTNP